MENLYTKDHEWVKIDNNTAAVGVTQYAAEQLGDITYIELPEQGQQYSKGEVLCEIESVKAASDVYAPLSGTVTKTNDEIVNSPELVNSDPEDKAWIAELELSNPQETVELMDAEQYQEYIKQL
ncbi:MAG: glycine cleavage system protein GcvH [Elusimicrobiota bacterium]